MVESLDKNLDIPMILMGTFQNKEIRKDIMAYTQELKMNGENPEAMNSIIEKMSKVKDRKYKILA